MIKSCFKLSATFSLLFAIPLFIVIICNTISAIIIYDRINKVMDEPYNKKIAIADRNHNIINVNYSNEWNTSCLIKLQDIPTVMREAFIISEDKNFYSHNGIDIPAKFQAAHEIFKHPKSKPRGASTISEQVVRIIYNRPRIITSKIQEFVNALQLEQHFTKTEILEFYLNQIPFASNRRGVCQAAEYYFERHLNTLNLKEMLTLAVMIRAPSSFNLYSKYDEKTLTSSPLYEKIMKSVMLLGRKLVDTNVITVKEFESIHSQKLRFAYKRQKINNESAKHFVNFVYQNITYDAEHKSLDKPIIVTTIDSQLQTKVQEMLNSQLIKYAHRDVRNAALVILNHENGEVLTWAISNKNKMDEDIDAVLVPRQPASIMKPLLYAFALEKGVINKNTKFDDAPLIEKVGDGGLHKFLNYSHKFYGQLSLNEVLGNSLNIPAIYTMKLLDDEEFSNYLKAIGIYSIHSDLKQYGDGIALGNAEVTLLEMANAFAVLARGGVYMPVRFLASEYNMPIKYTNEYIKKQNNFITKRIISDKNAAIISEILSDANSRLLEFGSHGVLNFRRTVSVKTGTSSDYRDAWAVGYDKQYVVCVWFGNLDAKRTKGATGTRVAATVMRNIFNELDKGRYYSKTNNNATTILTSYKTLIDKTDISNGNNSKSHYLINLKELDGVVFAIDPRIPRNKQQLTFNLDDLKLNNTSHDNSKLTISIDKELLNQKDSLYTWQMSNGEHSLIITSEDKNTNKIDEILNVKFTVIS